MGTWSEGRPVFKKVGGETRFLFIKEGRTEWYVSGSITGDDTYLVSGRATNSPGSAEAGPSVRSGTTSWRYFDEGNLKKVPGTINSWPWSRTQIAFGRDTRIKIVKLIRLKLRGRVSWVHFTKIYLQKVVLF